MVIYSGFSHSTWRFSTAMLAYQRVTYVILFVNSNQYDLWYANNYSIHVFSATYNWGAHIVGYSWVFYPAGMANG